MSNLQELIDKTIHDIQFNGCKLPESIIKLQFDNIVACAKLEESIERNNTYLESIGTAFGNGGNDRPNVIGDCITEPSLTPDQLVKGEWYVVKDIYLWLIQFDEIIGKTIYCLKTQDIDQKSKTNMGKILGRTGLTNTQDVKSIRPATKEEVLKYFPDEPFGEPADYVNPITN